MPKRKPISLSTSLGGFRMSSRPTLMTSLGSNIPYDLVSRARQIQQEAAIAALNGYSADQYPVIPEIDFRNYMYVPNYESNFSMTPSRISPSSKGKGYKYDGTQAEFTNELYNSYYKAVRAGAKSDEDAKRQARFLAQKAAYETGYGSTIINTHNYGGHKTSKGWMAFSSVDDYTKKDVALLDKKWSNWRDAQTPDQFATAITTNNGYGQYAPPEQYTNYKGLTKRVQNYLNMDKRRLRCGGKVSRPKAFLGALIGAATSIGSALMSAKQQEDAYERQKKADDKKYYGDLAANIANQLNNRDAQQAYESLFRVNYSRGGRHMAHTKGFSITDGGYGVPLGDNTLLLRGRLHEEVNESGNTGIGMRVGNTEVEAEDGEVVQKKPREIRIFSAEPNTLLNGVAPADAVRAGANKDEIFAIQQYSNGDYNPTRTRNVLRRIGNPYRERYYVSDIMRNGGRISRPVERIKFWPGGDILKNAYKKARTAYRTGRQAIYDARQAYTNSELANKLRENEYTGPAVQTLEGVGNTVYDALGISRGPEGGIYGNNDYTTDIDTENYSTGDDIRERVANRRRELTEEYKRKIKGYDDSTPSTVSGGRRGGSMRSSKLATTSTQPTQSTLLLDKNQAIEPHFADYKIQGPTLEEANKLGDMARKASINSTAETTSPSGVRFGFDWNNLGSAIATGVGGLASGLIGLSTANKIPNLRESAPEMAVKLPTHYSIRPQLDEVERARSRMLEDSAETSSSAAKHQRRTYANTRLNDMTNKLFAEQLNKENEMLTRDALNQQGVMGRNAERYNEYLARDVQQNNYRALARNQALNDIVSAIPNAVGGYFDQLAQNRNDERVMNWYLATLPEKDRTWFIRNMRGNRKSFTRLS